MGNLVNLSINNGAATPVAHIFEPSGKTVEGVVAFNDKVLGVAIAYPVLTVSLRRPTKTSRNFRLMGKVVIPALEVSSGVNSQGFTPPSTVAYSTLGTFEFVLPERSTLAERKDIHAYVVNTLSNALIKSMITDYVDLY